MTAHALTIDLEDWHQLMHRRVTGRLIPPTRAVVDATHRLLDLLDEAGIRATFFVMSMVAETYPDLVLEVARRGHEIGSHTHSHQLIYRMERDAFRADMERSVNVLRELTGQPVIGFRAPEFSVGSLDHWCFEVLAEVGIQYDSSVFPMPGPRYGIPDAPRRPFTLTTPAGEIREYPLAIWQRGRRPLPIAGGTYFRIFRAKVLKDGLAEIDAAATPGVFYFHPYEFYDRFLWLEGLTLAQRIRVPNLKYTLLHNLLTGRIAQRLRPLLASQTFRPLGEIYEYDRTESRQCS